MDSAELREMYGRMNDGELEVVANEAYDLTDVAIPLLREEIARRELDIPLRMERSSQPMKVAAVSKHFDPTKLDLVVVNTYWDLERALKVREFLNGAGIPCYWGPHNIENPEELTASFEQGVELTVMEEDLARVRGGLSELFKDEPEDAEAAKDFVFACPKCGSPEILFHEVDAQTAKFNWSCDECGHEWNDDGVEQHA